MSDVMDSLVLEINATSVGAESEIDRLCKTLDKLKNHMKFGGSAKSLITALQQISTASKSIENVNFTKFQKQMEALSKSLSPLNGFKSQAGAVINSLSGFVKSAEQLNNFTGFDKFRSQIETMSSSLSSLGSIDSKVNAAISSLNSVKTVAKDLNSINFSGFTGSVNQLANATTSLGDIKPRIDATVKALGKIKDIQTALQGADISNEVASLQRGMNAVSKAFEPLANIRSDGMNTLLNNLRMLPQVEKAITSAKIGDATNSLSRGLYSLVGTLKQFERVGKINLSGSLGQLDKLPQISDALSAINPGNFAVSVNGFTAALRNISGASKSLESLDFSKFGKQIEMLSTSLSPLRGFQSQAGNLISSLQGFVKSAEQLNDFRGFDAFKAQIELLANSFQPLSSIDSRIGATIKALGNMKTISNDFNTIDFSGFANSISQLTKAMAPLGDIKSRIGATVTALSQIKGVQLALQDTKLTGDAKSLESNMKALAKAFDPLANIKSSGIGTLLSNLKSLKDVENVISSVNFGDTAGTFDHGIYRLAEALKQLETVGKINLSGTIGQLKKLPEITAAITPENMEAFSASMQRLSEALAPLAKRLDKMKSSLNALNRLIDSTTRSNDRLEQSNRRVGSSFGFFSGGITRTIAKMTMLYMTARRVLRVLNSWFEESNKYIENQNLFTITMGENAAAAQEYAESVSSAFGIDVSEWMRYQGNFAAIANGFGLAADKAQVFSQNLTQMSYDMSSFFNVDVETAYDKLSSGIVGQVKGLREFGIDLTVAAMKEYALAEGIEKNVTTMTQAEKAQLRYMMILDRTNGIMNDLGRTIITPANAVRVLEAQITQLERSMGNLLSTFITKWIPYVQAFVRITSEAAQNLAEMWGFKLPEIDYSGLDPGATIDDTNEGLEEAIDNANKLKKNLMGFDEINLLKSPDDDGSSDAGAGGTLDFELPEYDFFKDLNASTQNVFDEVKKNIEDLKRFAEDLEPVFAGAFGWLIGGALVSRLGKLGSVFSKIKNTGIVGYLGKTVSAFMALFASFKTGQQLYSGKGNPVVQSLTILGSTALFSSLFKVLGIATKLNPALAVISTTLSLVAGAAYQAHKEMTELRNDTMDENFFDGVGVSLSYLVDDLEKSYEAIAGFTDTILETSGAIAKNDEEIVKLCNDVNTYTVTMAALKPDRAKEYYDELTESVSGLTEKVKENIDLMGSQTLTYFANIDDSTFENLDTTREAVVQQQDDATLVLQNKLTELETEAQAIIVKLENDPGNDALLEQLQEKISEINTLNGTDAIKENFDVQMDKLAFSSDTTVEDLERAKAATDEYKASLDAAAESEAAILRREYLAGGLTEAEYKVQVQAVWDDLESDKAEIDKQLEGFAADVMESFDKQMSDAIDTTQFSWWDKLTAGVVAVFSKEKSYGDVLGEKAVEKNPKVASIYDSIKGLAEMIGEEAPKITVETDKLGTDMGDTMTSAFERSSVKISEVSKSAGKSIREGIMEGIGTEGIKIPVTYETTPFTYANTGRSRNIRGFASGGFPDAGSMFIANEAGPELVGNIGRKTAVANNDQIVSAVARGVSEAVAAVMGNGGSSQPINLAVAVEIDKQKVGEASVEYINDTTMAYGTSPLR